MGAPIYLPVPAHRNGGPDGRGWNRLSLNAHIGASGGQCAFLPTGHAALWMARYRPHSTAYGSFGPCARAGDCQACPVPHMKRTLETDADAVLVRVVTVELSPMQTAEVPTIDGERWTWAALFALDDWDIDARLCADRVSFWIRRRSSAGTGALSSASVACRSVAGVPVGRQATQNHEDGGGHQ